MLLFFRGWGMIMLSSSVFSLNVIFAVLSLYKDLKGIYSAREFVWWYNGHPDCRNLAPDLQSTDTAVILGQVSPNSQWIVFLWRYGYFLKLILGEWGPLSCHLLDYLSEFSCYVTELFAYFVLFVYFCAFCSLHEKDVDMNAHSNCNWTIWLCYFFSGNEIGYC